MSDIETTAGDVAVVTRGARPTPFHRECVDSTCIGWVHRNARKCAICGAPSPWTNEGKLWSFDRWIVTRDFSTTIGIQFSTFQQGQVLTDLALVAQLVSEGSPIEPEKGHEPAVFCPHCHKGFIPGESDEDVDELDASGFPRRTLPYQLLV